MSGGRWQVDSPFGEPITVVLARRATDEERRRASSSRNGARLAGALFGREGKLRTQRAFEEVCAAMGIERRYMTALPRATIVGQLARAVENGRLLIVRPTAARFSATRPVALESIPRQPPPPRKRSWIEIEIVDPAGTPYRGDLTIQMPNGDVQRVSTNSNGTLRFDDLDAGDVFIVRLEQQSA